MVGDEPAVVVGAVLVGGGVRVGVVEVGGPEGVCAGLAAGGVTGG